MLESATPNRNFQAIEAISRCVTENAAAFSPLAELTVLRVLVALV